MCGHVCLSLRFESSFKMNLWGYTIGYRIFIRLDYISLFCFRKIYYLRLKDCSELVCFPWIINEINSSLCGLFHDAPGVWSSAG